MDKETANYVLDAVKGLVFKDKKVSVLYNSNFIISLSHLIGCQLQDGVHPPQW